MGDLNKIEGDVVNPEVLRKADLIRKTRRVTVKILGDGQIKRAFKVEGVKVSKEARAKLEKAGGEIVVKKEVKTKLKKTEKKTVVKK